MDYLRQYRSFVNSYYLTEGVRITIGIALPAIVLNSLHQLPAGILVSIGAMCASVPDNAGPILHRRNAMLVCDALIFIVALVMGLVTSNPLLLAISIFISCFIFSMIGVFGARATSIGLSALLVMVLSIDRSERGAAIIVNAVYILLGGIWYTLLSLTMQSVRPFKLAQQALGECIQATAGYLRIRAGFYRSGEDIGRVYEDLLVAQADVQAKQDLVRELLFRSRNLTKESTDTGRRMVMIYLDLVDLFERIITVHEDYRTLHHQFENDGILTRFELVIRYMADRLDDIGLGIKSGQPSRIGEGLRDRLDGLRNDFESFRDKNRNAGNLEGFISLRQILENIADVGERIYAILDYSEPAKKDNSPLTEMAEQELPPAHQDIEPKLFIDNLALSSNTFRHAIRLSIATTAGFLVSKLFPVNHSYWILLTIIVILKPAYSLTKKRNFHRLLGTVVGAVFGFLILLSVKDNGAVFVIMIILMIGAYSFMRTNYLVFVSLMTPYILLLFHLLNASNFSAVVKDRLIDTAIGSAIAFLANVLVLPVWEHEQIRDYLIKMIGANRQYFLDLANSLFGKASPSAQYRLSRKEALVALANLSDAFNRMLSEPKNRQKSAQQIHQFVVANHMLTSNIATLSLFNPEPLTPANKQLFSGAVENISGKLKRAEDYFDGHAAAPAQRDQPDMRGLNGVLGTLLRQRKNELENGIIDSDTRKELSLFKPVADQFNFIYKAAAEIERLSSVISEDGNL
ncbi:MAG TPA: FUSC family membrane protein [Puia sp.]|nr:FUSC family membrane protein [Puia sp.]